MKLVRPEGVLAWPFFWQAVAAFCVGLAVPALSLIAIHYSGVSFTSGPGVEAGNYSRSALGLYGAGSFVFQSGGGVWIAEIERFIGYPLFLALGFWAAGGESYEFVAVFQCILAAGTVLVIGLAGREVDKAWFWPAVLLASATLNIGYRASAAMPDLLAVFVSSLVALGIVRMLYGRRLWVGTLVAMLGCAAALGTRPAFLLLTVGLTLPLIWALSRYRGMTWRGAVVVGLLPLLASAIPIAAQVAWIHNQTGQYAMTVQKGEHLARYLYPCLTDGLGCGDPDPAALHRVNTLISEELARLPSDLQNDRVAIDEVKARVSTELIQEIPISQVAIATVGAAVKLLFHSSVGPIIERFGLNNVMPGTVAWGGSMAAYLKNYASALVAHPEALLWVLAQVGLVFMRMIQVVGLIGGLFTPRFRVLSVLCLAALAALLAPTVGMGNPRYRAPMEPFLIVLSVQGFAVLLFWWHRLRRTDRGRGGRVGGQAAA